LFFLDLPPFLSPSHSLFTVEKNGDVCISILHEPGEDKWGYEKPEERWLPIHTVETILISVISMLADPNDESPANVDAAVSSSL
jgi:ubiquitin-conjugating enzyme E2 G1